MSDSIRAHSPSITLATFSSQPSQSTTAESAAAVGSDLVDQAFDVRRRAVVLRAKDTRCSALPRHNTKSR